MNEFFIVRDRSGTDAFIYSDGESALKRLSSGIKRPSHWNAPEILHLVEYKECEKIRTALYRLMLEIKKEYPGKSIDLIIDNPAYRDAYNVLYGRREGTDK